MAEKQVCDVYLIVNESGDYTVAPDLDAAHDEMTDNFGGAMRRAVRLEVSITLPVEEHVLVDVPDEAGTTTTVKPE